jgi:hypothetical protein
MSEMDHNTDDGDSSVASQNHVESDVEEEDDQQQQQEQQKQEDERKDEESSDDDGWTYPKNNTYQPI